MKNIPVYLKTEDALLQDGGGRRMWRKQSQSFVQEDLNTQLVR